MWGQISRPVIFHKLPKAEKETLTSLVSQPCQLAPSGLQWHKNRQERGSTVARDTEPERGVQSATSREGRQGQGME